MNSPDNVTYEFGPFLLEPHARRLSRNGESVPLATAEFELLLLLVRNQGRKQNREIVKQMFTIPVLFGETLIVKARRIE